MVFLGILGYHKNMKKTIQFTLSGFEKIKKDFEKLSEKRKTAVINLQKAREMGDLSENGAYKAARFELSGIDRELKRLKYLLQFGKIVDSKINSNFVTFGSKITIKSQNNEMTFTLVGPEEANPTVGNLSTDSPLGKAVLGKKKREKFAVLTPNGQVEYEITNLI